MEGLEYCNIGQRMGAEMHTNHTIKWVYKNGLDESLIEASTKYKVWLDVEEKKDPNQKQGFTCEVYWFEKVPQQILDAEELTRKYWAQKEPTNKEPNKSVKLIGTLRT